MNNLVDMILPTLNLANDSFEAGYKEGYKLGYKEATEKALTLVKNSFGEVLTPPVTVQPRETQALTDELANAMRFEGSL
jgi:flagellar biosynthesis/type III secretory pathway protein FliH